MNEFLHVLLKIFEMIYQSSGIQIFIAAINTNVTLDHSQPSLTAGPRWPVAGESLKSVLVSPRCLRSVAPMPATAAAQATLMHPGCSCSRVWPLTTGPAPGLQLPIVQSQPAGLSERPRGSGWRPLTGGCRLTGSRPQPAAPARATSFEGHRSQLTWAEGPWAVGA